MRIIQKSLTLNQPDKKSRFSFKRLSFGKWNQILSAVVCMLGFALIFSMMLIHTLDNGESNLTNSTKIPLPLKKQQIAAKESNKISNCIRDAKCSLLCTGLGLSDDIPAIIEREFKLFDPDQCGKQIDKLMFSNMMVKDSTLRENWLNSADFSVNHLNIIGGNIENIEPGAFNTKIFQYMRVLTIENITFEKLKANTFVGLKRLTTLSIRQCSIFEIEPDAVKYISDTLTELQIQKTINRFDPTNITGKNNFPSLSEVDFRFNNMQNSITSETFSGISTCLQLFLRGSQISQIGDKAFAKLTKLVLLDIGENNIKTMQSTVFRNDSMPGSIFIDKNKWNCICELQWLQDLKIADVVKFDPTCETPEEVEYHLFTDVDFCPDGPLLPTTSTKSSTSSTAPTASTPTTSYISTTTTKLPPSTGSNVSSTLSTQPTESSIEISCIEAKSTFVYLTNYNRKLLSLDYIDLPRQMTLFNLSDGDIGIVNVDIDYSMSPTDIIIWFIGKLDVTDPFVNRNTIGCMTNLFSSVKVDNLISGETYIFCLIKETERKISPLNCRAHETQKPWPLQIWLANDDKTIALIILIAGYVLCCFIGAIFIYILVRRNPSLLRGSKRIMLVKHRAAEAIVVPSNFKNLTDIKPVDEQKIPKPKKNKNLSKKTHFRRSVSDTSMFSLRSLDASYVSAVEPTAFQLLHWRLERLRNNGNAIANKSNTLLVPAVSPSAVPPRLPDRPSTSKSTIDEVQNISDYSEV